MFDFSNASENTAFDATSAKDIAVFDRLNNIREMHERLDVAIRDQQMAVQTARARVFR